MLDIRSIGYLEYLIALEKCRSSLADYYLRCRGNTLKILGAFDANGQGEGVLLYDKRSSGDSEICWIKVRHPGHGVGNALLTYLVEQEKGDNRRIILKVISGSSCGNILVHMAEKHGFYLMNKVELFQSSPQDIPNWKRYMEKHGKAIIGVLEEQGFEAISFEEISEELWNQLQDTDSNDFDLSLNPAGIMRGWKGEFCKNMSYLSLKDGKPAAYCLVCRPDRGHYVFEAISSSVSFQNTGVIFQPLAMAIEAVVGVPFCKIGYAMYRNNKKAIALSQRMIQHVISSRDMQYNYELR